MRRSPYSRHWPILPPFSSSAPNRSGRRHSRVCTADDGVVVWKMDRLGRSLLHLIETVNLLNGRGIQLRSLIGNLIDTTTHSGKLVFGIFGMMAAFERDMLRQRANAGLAAARKRGRVGGKPKSIDASALKKARVMLASGDYTMTGVAAELQVSRHTLWRELARVRAS